MSAVAYRDHSGLVWKPPPPKLFCGVDKVLNYRRVWKITPENHGSRDFKTSVLKLKIWKKSLGQNFPLKKNSSYKCMICKRNYFVKIYIYCSVTPRLKLEYFKYISHNLSYLDAQWKKFEIISILGKRLKWVSVI